MGWHLAGDADDRHRIHQCIGETGDGIGRAGPGRHEHDADTTRRAGVTLRGVYGALLVTHEHVGNLVLLDQLIVDRQNRTAWIAEDVLDALILQGLQDHLGTVHCTCHRLAPRGYHVHPAGNRPQGGTTRLGERQGSTPAPAKGRVGEGAATPTPAFNSGLEPPPPSQPSPPGGRRSRASGRRAHPIEPAIGGQAPRPTPDPRSSQA